VLIEADVASLKAAGELELSAAYRIAGGDLQVEEFAAHMTDRHAKWRRPPGAMLLGFACSSQSRQAFVQPFAAVSEDMLRVVRAVPPF
jgi:hypothetical protein